MTLAVRVLILSLHRLAAVAGLIPVAENVVSLRRGAIRAICRMGR